MTQRSTFKLALSRQVGFSLNWTSLFPPKKTRKNRRSNPRHWSGVKR